MIAPLADILLTLVAVADNVVLVLRVVADGALLLGGHRVKLGLVHG